MRISLKALQIAPMVIAKPVNPFQKKLAENKTR